MDIQRKTSGNGIRQIGAAVNQPVAEIALAISLADDGIAALLELLDAAPGHISAASVAALLRPHSTALQRASAALLDNV
ncbi:hypothetical protein ACFJIX_18885 [Roseateles sp. UC29_93]|uniref:hypothetical protein n=1 Tax=Roseateles sp. UC29_93 TaxID=3350177 RepID=UPI00366C7E89